MTAWTPEDDAFLMEAHGRESIADIANRIGRTKAAVRNRVMRLGISKRELWTPEEEAQLRDLYEQAGSDGPLALTAFAASVGRCKSNVSRKARELGLGTNASRRKVDQRKVRVPKFSSKAELSAHVSARQKQWIQENGHPRGMAGKSHSATAKAAISKASKTYHLAETEDMREERLKKAAATRVKNSYAPPQVARGSWRAGWREIGGKRNYYRSRWEANYARYLQWLKEMRQIRDWEHEPKTFWFEAVRRGVRSYKPDFLVTENNGSQAWHEVKGWMDSRSRTTLARMKKYHPEERVILIDQKGYAAIGRKVSSLVPGWEVGK